MARNRRNNIVADGRARVVAAQYKQVKREVRQRYAAQLAEAGMFRRWWLLWKVRREIQSELEKIAPTDALYAQRKAGGP
ncbi:MAG: hypothetical protein ACYTFA_19065 [Planctomycetota bacterium]